MVTLKMALQILHGIPAAQHEKDDSIRALAHEINQQWMASKGDYDPTRPPHWAFRSQRQLIGPLNQVFEDWDESDSVTNPMNFLLPGYETLWRIVLRCFLELNFRGHSDAPHWQAVLKSFADQPTPTQLDSASADASGVCARDIVQEALRLYPPTRRIYRDYIDELDRTVSVAADVEGMHRDESVWQDDACLFNPDRWNRKPIYDGSKQSEQTRLTDFAEAHFMSFGRQPFRCPARRRFPVNGDKSGKSGFWLPFGLTMISMLTAALTDEIGEKWRLNASLPETAPLDTGREAYEELMLERC